MTIEQDLAIRLRHENRLRGWANKFARTLARRVGSDAARGLRTDVERTAHELLRSELRAHYDRVMGEFATQQSDALPDDLKPGDLERGLIRAHLEKFATDRADEVTGLHLATAAGFVDYAHRVASEAQAADGGITMDERGVLVQTAFFRRERALILQLCATETTWAGETAKAVEIAVLLNQDGMERKQDDPVAFKTWRSVGDSRVRAAPESRFDHLRADGQRVRTDQPFMVSGELLRWPGDTSLGASTGNIIRCRCGAIYDQPTVRELRRKVIGDLLVDREIPAPGTESELVIGREITVPKPPTPTPPKPIKPPTPPKPPPPPKPPKPKPVPVPKPPKKPPVPKPPPTPEPAAPAFSGIPKEAIQRAKEEIAKELGELPKRVDLETLQKIRKKLAKLNGPSDFNLGKYVEFVGSGARGKTNVKREQFRNVFRDLTDGLVHPSLLQAPELREMKVELSRALRHNFRAYANQRDNMIALTVNHTRTTMAHEIGHHIEFRNPKLRTRNAAWRDGRDEERKLNGIPKTQSVQAYEKRDRGEFKDGGFVDPYIGRVYPWGDTEVLSMGIQALYSPKELENILRRDPDYFALIWATLRGY